jgi:regulatory protein
VDALGYSLRLLKSRLRSVWEIDQALQKREVPLENRREVIAKLGAANLLDDLRFARAWVTTRDRLSPRGATVLRQELLQKGIDRGTIDQVLRERKDAAQDDEEEQKSELELARELMERRQRTYANLDRETRNRRLASFLQRRGFSFDVIKRILDT